MVRILVNGVPLMGLQTGMARYVRCLYQAMENMPEVEVRYQTALRTQALMPPPAVPEQWCQQTRRFWRLPDPIIVALSIVQRQRLEIKIRSSCRKSRYDLYHETDFFPPTLNKVPIVFTLHDLSLITHPDKHPRERVWFTKLFFKRRLHSANHIITVSQFIRREIINTLSVDPDKITVIYEAPSPIFGPRTRNEIEETLHRLCLPRNYFLFVGTQEPRKNLDLLIEAMAMINQPFSLVLTGWSGWGDRQWIKRVDALDLAGRIFQTGYVDEETLVRLYCGARALVYPSLYEGFGLPILEAMACGCPVICSHVASLPEVAGDAALYIDPQDPRSLAGALEALTENPGLREEYSHKGHLHGKRFSWQKSAQDTLALFRKLAR